MNRIELASCLNKNHIPASWYELDGRLNRDQTTFLLPENGKWLVFYQERGDRYKLAAFDTEAAACDELIVRMNRQIDFHNRHKGN